MARRFRDPDLGRARRAVLEALERAGVAVQDDAVERARFVARGLSRKAYVVGIDAPPEVLGEVPPALVVLVPLPNEVGEVGDWGEPRLDIQREARLLRWLAAQRLGFDVPRFASVVEEEGVALLVCEAVEGFPTGRGRRWRVAEPWQLAARAAAGVHRADVTELDWLGGHPSRRAHAEHVVRELAPAERAPHAQAAHAWTWLADHLPPNGPARLVHGDLLGQNLLVRPDESLVLLDWERAHLGDPAYDLAVLTAGGRRPFGIEGGKRRLLEAYAECADEAVEGRAVRFHEIAIRLGEYLEGLSGVEGVRRPEEVAGTLGRLVR